MSADGKDARRAAMAWLIWALGSAAFGYAFVQRIAPSVMVQDLMREFAVGAAVLGNLSAIYLYAYAGLQIPVGILTDRFGARLMIALSLTIAGIGNIVFMLADTIVVAYLARLMIGAGASFGFVGTLMLVGRWFPARRFAFMSGLTMCLAMICAVFSQSALATMVVALGWRSTMAISAALGLTLALLVAIIVRNAPGNERPHGETRQSWGQLGRGLVEVLTNIRVWNAGILAASTSAIMLAFGGLWGPPYLMTRYGFERPEAAFYSSLIFAGLAIGAPFAGWLTDRIGRRKSPVIAAAAVQLAAALYLFMEAPLAPWLVPVPMLVLGLAAGFAATTYVYAREVTRPGVEGAVTGFINTFMVGSGALFQPLVGFMLDLGWDGTTDNGVRVYGTEAYRFAFTSLIAACALAMVCAAFMRETNARRIAIPATA